MSYFRGTSISERLTRMNLLVSGTVLLLAALAFFSYDLLSFRHTLVRNLDAESQIVGENSISALTFDDPQSAATTLESLERSPDVQAAVLVRPDGSMFARYGAAEPDLGEQPRLADGKYNHVWLSETHVVTARRIMFHGNAVGVVYIAAHLGEIGQRARQFFLIVCLVLLFCMFAAVFISSISQRLIAEPIIALAKTAQLVSREQNYAVRAKVESDGSEITVLVDSFNTMLTQIQERDAALNEARAGLEARVEERTAELQAANRELEAFSYTVAHDLRGPLDAIHGIVFLLAHSYEGSNDAEAMLEQLKTSTGNMSSLIDDLLHFARATTTPMKSVPVNMTAIVQEIAAELKSLQPERQVEFSIDELSEVTADPGLMHIVLDNLLRNSWKYTSHHAKACIEFGAKMSGDGLIYFVRDDGAGFDMTRRGELFQPFQRLHGKGDFPGTGIGLATVERILTRQGGTIWAEGAVEKGAAFFFTLG